MANSVAIIADPRTGKSYKKEVTPENMSILTGRKLGEEIDGIFFEMPGYKLKITGGSSIDGFPMRRDLTTSGKKRILVTYAEGRRAKKGIRKRVTFRGAIIGSDISQLNLSILQYGPKALDEPEAKN
jgi:small subunit ribosomal protein S6e